MRKTIQITFLLFIFFGLTAMSLHRFYVAIYQVNYVAQKKMIQITTRIFVDDLNDALKKKYQVTTFIGSEKESLQDITLMKKYLADKFKLTINGHPKNFNYLSNELENNVIICYLNIKDVSKISSIEVENTVLIELYPDQQNIIQYNNNGKKQNLLLTDEITKRMLK
jgi:hypothetical protein